MIDRDKMRALLEKDTIAQALIRSRARPEREKRRDRLTYAVWNAGQMGVARVMMDDLFAELEASERDRVELKRWRVSSARDVGIMSDRRWLSVVDELPEVNVRVLACYLNLDFKRSGPTGFVTYLRQSRHWDTSSIVTHWMPLPGPPERSS